MVELIINIIATVLTSFLVLLFLDWTGYKVNDFEFIIICILSFIAMK